MAEDGDDDPIEEMSTKLPDGPEKDEIMALFKQFDLDSVGNIPIQRLKSVTMSVGPGQTKLLDYLSQMDFNGDGMVEPDEWEMYFANVLPALGEDATKLVTAELKEAAECVCTARARRRSFFRASLADRVSTSVRRPCTASPLARSPTHRRLRRRVRARQEPLHHHQLRQIRARGERASRRGGGGTEFERGAPGACGSAVQEVGLQR